MNNKQSSLRTAGEPEPGLPDKGSSAWAGIGSASDPCHSGLSDKVSGLGKSGLLFLAQYNAWCSEETSMALSRLPENELFKERLSVFKNMVLTYHHIYLIDDIFRSHLLGIEHDYTTRTPEVYPALAEIIENKRAIDQWYLEQIASWTDDALGETVKFRYIGGDPGMMSREEIILHVINHSTYHRGMIAAMFYQIPASPPVTDISVYVRDL